MEILEDIPITPSLIEKLKYIKKIGFLIALDDFILQNNINLYDELFSLVNFIKVDFMLSKPSERQVIERIVKKNYPHIVLLAEKVETREEFYLQKKRDMDYSKGTFLLNLKLLKEQTSLLIWHNIFELLACLATQDSTIEQIAEEIERDVSLSFKVLKMINSPTARKRSKIRSIKQAVVMLGLEELNHWLYVLMLRESKVNHNGDGMAIIEASLFRAKFCELLAKKQFITKLL